MLTHHMFREIIKKGGRDYIKFFRRAYDSPLFLSRIPSQYLIAPFLFEIIEIHGIEVISFLREGHSSDEQLFIPVVEKYPETIFKLCHKTIITKDLFDTAIQGFNFDSVEEAVESNPDLIMIMPEDYKSKEICLSVLNKDIGFLIYIPEKYLSINMVKKYLEKEYSFLKDIPKSFRTKEICMYAFNKDSDNISAIPEEYITTQMVETAVMKGNLLSLKDIPEKFLTKDICLLALNSNPFYKFNEIPKNIIDKELVMTYIKNHDNSVVSSSYFSHIPSAILDYDIILPYIKHDGLLLEHIPVKLLTHELCLMAVTNNCESIQFVPKEFITYDMCLAYAESTSDPFLFSESESDEYFKYIPREYLTEELCMKAVKNKLGFFYCIPKELLTYNICLEAISNPQIKIRELFHFERKSILKRIPAEFLTKEICDIGFENDYQSIVYIPEEYVTEDMLIEIAKRDPTYLGANFPDRFRTKTFINKLKSFGPRVGFYMEHNFINALDES